MRDQLMPLATDKLFIPEVGAENWLSTSKKSFFSYSEGYRQAGESLYKEIQKCEPFHKRFLTYPMLFCFRQFIELRLKELIFLGKKINDLPENFPLIHEIGKLFDDYVNNILLRIDGNFEENLIANARNLVYELDKLDNKSMSFRYPVLKDDSPSILLPNMNIDNFKVIMDRLSNFLDRQLDIMQHSEEMKQEMISELYSQLRSEYQYY